MRVPTMTEVIMREIQKRVMDGFYKPGQKLNVDELARELSVSKTPVREALGRLARQGIVESRSRIGWRVSLLSSEEFLQFQEVKHLIRSYLSRQIVPYAGKINFEKIQAMNSNMHHFTKTRQFDRLLEENDKFHMEIFSVYPNKVLLEYLDEVSSAIRLQRIFMLEEKHLDEESPLITEAAMEHEEIIDALKKGDALEIIASFEKHQMTIRESSQPETEK